MRLFCGLPSLACRSRRQRSAPLVRARAIVAGVAVHGRVRASGHRRALAPHGLAAALGLEEPAPPAGASADRCGDPDPDSPATVDARPMRTSRLFDALPPYLGGKRRLVPLILADLAAELPPAEWPRASFCDPMCGGGAVALAAKAQGFEVYATAGVVALGDRNLVDRKEVVGGGVGVVDDGGLVAADCASGGAVLDVHALDEHAVEGAVTRLEGRALGPGQFAEGVVKRLEGQVRVEPRERVTQAPLQHDGAVAGALLARRAGADVGSSVGSASSSSTTSIQRRVFGKRPNRRWPIAATSSSAADVQRQRLH